MLAPKGQFNLLLFYEKIMKLLANPAMQDDVDDIHEFWNMYEPFCFLFYCTDPCLTELYLGIRKMLWMKVTMTIPVPALFGSDAQQPAAPRPPTSSELICTLFWCIAIEFIIPFT